MMSDHPTPHELWVQSGEDGERYRELLREHGHVLWPGGTGYAEGSRNLPCGWPGERSAAQALTHWTPEEEDQPACDVEAPGDVTMFGTLNPSRVTCPACIRKIGGDDAAATGALRASSPVSWQDVPTYSERQLQAAVAAERKRIRDGVAKGKFTLWRPGSGPAHGEEFEVVPAEALEKLLGEGP
jgi:hypothetical protein